MATKYWCKKGAVPASTKVGTEANPIDGPADLAAALNDGRCPVGTEIVFMGELGALTLADSEADFPNTLAAAVSNSLTITATLTTTAGIVFGTTYANTSTASGRRFTCRGDLDWHVDMRGGTTNAQRQRAALAFQGTDIEIDGWRIAAADWNYIGDGTNRITKASQGTPGNTYAAECSEENIGILLLGAWGSHIHDLSLWGSDAFSRNGLRVAFLIPAGGVTTYDNTDILVENVEAWGSYFPVYVNTNGFLNNDNFKIPTGSRVLLDQITAHHARWGDTLTTPTKNNSMAHGGPISLAGRAVRNSMIKASRLEAYGWAQDAIELISQNGSIEDSYVHDLNPGYAWGGTFHYWWHDGTNWVDGTSTVVGDAIKTGLSDYDWVAGASWMDPGTTDGSTAFSSVDQLRNRVLRCRVVNGTGTTYYAVTTNGSGGTMVHACEFSGMYDGIRFARNTEAGIQAQQSWASNNYIQATNRAITVAEDHTVYLYNNILDGAYDIATDAAATVLNGANNLLVNNSAALTGGTTNNLQNTMTGAAEYTLAVGPDPGGNCASAGSGAALFRGRFEGVFRDKRNAVLSQTHPPLGPFRPGA